VARSHVAEDISVEGDRLVDVLDGEDPRRRQAAEVPGIAPRSDPETRRAQFYVELDRAPADMRAGLLVRITLLSQAASGELWLPVTAVLLKDGGRRVVYVEEPDGKFAPREVEVSDGRGGQVRVLKGLQAGERVVMRGALLVDREAEQLL
jgi:cobalt-zinc-cadmium efflux system membrane fusion protein